MSGSSQRYLVEPSKAPLRGEVRVPGDKSIGHRALIFGALAQGESEITNLSEGLDNFSTMRAFEQMGVHFERSKDRCSVRGVGLHGLRMAQTPIDCGNSGTTMRLLSGILCAQKFGSRLVGDASLTRRPMNRVIQPLRARGAHIDGTRQAGRDDTFPPINIAPLLKEELLQGLEYVMPMSSAQVKSALLLSGLYAGGPTALEEPYVSRDHTERMLLALGAPIRTTGAAVVLDPQEKWAGGWQGFQWHVPGDPSSAAFPLLAGLIVPGSAVTVHEVCTNPTRRGLFDLLSSWGAALQVEAKGALAGDEPVASMTTNAPTRLRGGMVDGEMVVRLIDEVPVLCALAAATGTAIEIRDAEELRVKESDRIAVMAQTLRAFGASCDELPDGMKVHAHKGKLHGAQIESHGDHRIAMSAVLLGLVAQGQTIVNDVACVETSFPGFMELMRGLGANIREERT